MEIDQRRAVCAGKRRRPESLLRQQQLTAFLSFRG